MVSLALEEIYGFTLLNGQEYSYRINGVIRKPTAIILQKKKKALATLIVQIYAFIFITNKKIIKECISLLCHVNSSLWNSPIKTFLGVNITSFHHLDYPI